MKLSDLFPYDGDLEIKSLSYDSREKTENALFFCIKGLLVDGHDFAQMAIDNGAVAIVAQRPLDVDVPVFIVEDSLAEINRVADEFYGRPTEDIFVYGITGTNGKTTIAHVLKNMLVRLGINAGYIGTVGVEYDGVKTVANHTTPEINKLQSFLNDMRGAGVTEVAIEASSQGLALHRVDSIRFRAAVFTNLTHDHLDYHKTMEAYFEAKKVLFDGIDENGLFVFNTDDAYSRRLIALNYPGTVVTYGLEDENASYRATDMEYFLDHTVFTLHHDGKKYPVKTSLRARFNVYNTLAVIALLHQRGHKFEDFLPLLADIDPVDGRQTVVDVGQPFKIFADYSHSPDGLLKLFEFMREITPIGNKVITVMSSYGARDKEKRPIIGGIGSSLTDYIILTDQDSRNEKVGDIALQVMEGITNNRYAYIEDRYEAIQLALRLAQPNDTVVLTGKGVERYMYSDYGKGDAKNKSPWMGDDACAIEILEKMYGGKKDGAK